MGLSARWEANPSGYHSPVYHVLPRWELIQNDPNPSDTHAAVKKLQETRACLQSSSDAAFRKSRIEEWRGSMVSLQTRPSFTEQQAEAFVQVLLEALGSTYDRRI